MKEIPKHYNFKEEVKTYERWEQSGFFNPDNIASQNKYANVLPPPNANGELHLGHASGYTIMDIFGRFERMQGKKVLLLPGKDHAGIQTQVVFEKKIKEEKGLSRQDLGREKFYQECYNFCIGRADYMRSQEKRIGISADWSREKFTLDPKLSETVLETFVKLYNDGLIYKGKRIINWCPRCATALSDVEVVHNNKPGKLYFIKYPFSSKKNQFITVATTRPETMLGDTAVAVNPKDKRYQKMIGEFLMLPLQNKEIPIVADRRIDQEFGTGAVKITPAHDMLDWQIGADNKLPVVQVIDEKAHITAEGGKYEGLEVLEAREAVLKDLKELDLLEKEEDIENNVSACERCKSHIEPLVSDQWFVRVDDSQYSLKGEAIKAIKENKIQFYPENFKDRMLAWYDNLQDWCISRQIWWGHRLPVWYREKEINLTLVRHAQTDWNVQKIMQGQTDVPLNDKGREQAHELKEVIRQEKIDVIIISPLKRTRETAEIINTFGLELVEDERLKERGYGKFEGMKTEELLKKHPEITTFEVGESLYWIDVPTAESYRDLRLRVRGFLEDVKRKYAGKNMLIVSHGDTLDMFYAELNGVKNEEAYGKFSHNGTLHKHKIIGTETYVGTKDPGGEGWKQEEDTFDTWFSSGQWAYTTLGYPEERDYQEFYPSDMMIMGRDILPFWASRMIMLGLYRTQQVPFENLYFTGLVRDKEGNKFSKSRGNGIDPLEMIDKYGADALRLSLVMDVAPGQDSRLFEEKIEGFRNFVTKLWNIARYATTANEKFSLQESISSQDIKTLADKWIVSELQETIGKATEFMNKRNLSLAQDALRKFTWDELADWYVETNKLEKNDKVLGYVLDKVLKLFHPFMPFVTENLYELLGGEGLLMTNAWPKEEKDLLDKNAKKEFQELKEVISRIRTIRASYHIDPKIKINIFAKNDWQKKIIEKLAHANLILREIEKGMLRIKAKSKEFGLDVSKVIDIKKEKESLEKEIEEIFQLLKKNEELLKNENFSKNAPENIILSTQNRVKEYQDKLQELRESLEELKSLK